ncbi:MAG: transcriptional regulator [Microgenomates group bacterium GW2011_GWC1_41_20]|uniref:Probable transcriptional regulatory protein UT93_C0027G0005 n=7 Tax=Candidatus Woeseibacteriota TaxID=1752722 RepID=A0A0G0RRG1_9BACT|nr:MAG: transcriptional regulator [Candidatus Woesebacteria bacterium GW2011_GWB1_40_12]KKR55088.1 MAG: transcriptional regulator [Candidatus Woesebacteria bacterium GW2011_GWF1_40_24]KKR90960.1 MAG: transcriptional regulator [Candidatus Woesebacteria bacterium GW2011_GWD1_41_12]KKS00561.1 MAG: transcriptional regulator [Microgenomates group bacterium GW2011_GWC1_41_20]KKS05417.1 MAG: transcriptional regulator [Candidatus Woesebacteria bacterium GW2011_GWE1_41_24]
MGIIQKAMSGHSHFATIKRQKATNDAAKGNLFSKLARAIMIAAKSGGDPDMNFKLRFEIDKARAASMPKENIDRAIAKATTEAANLEEIMYEGFGPGGIGVLIEVLSDNKNRTAQEIKNLFDRVGGSMGGPNSVAFNFESKGFMVIKKTDDPDTEMLELIDAGVEDMEDVGSEFEVYVAPDKLGQIHKALVAKGFEVKETELQMKPKNFVAISDAATAAKVVKFIEEVESHDDVQKMFTNADIPDALMETVA